MKIKDIEVDFDFYDADNVEKLEKSIENVKNKADSTKKKEMALSEAIRKECNIVEEFIDEVFGENMSEKIFNGKKNLLEHLKVFEDICNEKIKKQTEFENIYKKYSPNKRGK